MLDETTRIIKGPTDSDDRLCHLYYVLGDDRIVQRICDGVKMSMKEFKGDYFKKKNYDNCCSQESCKFLCKVCLSLGRGK